MTYKRIFWQSIDDFYFQCRNAHFFKTPRLYSSRFCGFEVGNGIESFMSGCTSKCPETTWSQSVFSFPLNE